MSIDLDLEHHVHRRVDEAQEMFLPLLKLPLRPLTRGAIECHILAVQEIVGCRARSIPVSEIVLLKRCCVVVVVDDDMTEINVIVGRGWPMDDHRSKHSFTVLSGEMAVIPRGSIRRGLEFVDLGMARGNGTLGDATDAIFAVGSQLSETVPVDPSPIVLKLVDDGDFQRVAPVGLDEWARKLTVDDQHLLGDANRRQGRVLDPQGPFPRDASLGPFRVGVGVDVIPGQPMSSMARPVGKSWVVSGIVGCRC